MTLREPNYLRFATIRHAMRATLAGRFDEVEPILEQHSPQHARHALEPNTVQAFGVVLFTLRRLQGRIGEVTDAFLDFARQYPAVPAWRTGLALLYIELGRLDDAARELAELCADDFEALPRDANWVVALCNLSEVAHRLRDQERAAALYEQLAPFAHRNVVVGGGWVCWGSTSRYLGMLAYALERWDDAETHFGVALYMNKRITG